MNALLLIDIQNDFIPGGSLAVPQGDQIIAKVNQIQSAFDLVLASQDWHPQNHISFAVNHNGKKTFEEIEWQGQSQTLWPAHCVQNSKGAAFHWNLDTQKIETIFRKGTDPNIDSYSAFYDNAHKKDTGLAGYLNGKGVTHLYFTGLAADICVYFSIKDALEKGFQCTLIEDCAKPLNQGTYQEQKEELRVLGVKYQTAKEFLKEEPA